MYGEIAMGDVVDLRHEIAECRLGMDTRVAALEEQVKALLAEAPKGEQDDGLYGEDMVPAEEDEDDPRISELVIARDKQVGLWVTAYYDFGRGVWFEVGTGPIEVDLWMYPPEPM